ncbi:hypothetical protein BCR33DRAFT_718900 [Rhizoclosmatium globosum]|uniref:Uncharacterized protein n=1 Tax=Rhizoclosmatium globosum TaxID=329046 RepID=A0A1Y2C2M6_9FUNG|nr:hypothetical protein BCR33DRAFT_718900 [Rhizoclosmatium globosum]|eukprot:ORY41251.1 hypothetical protein BCR33DRAFT_718900 [Rhizoclosmatium globosum]
MSSSPLLSSMELGLPEESQEPFCRICLSSEEPADLVLLYVHRICLEKWHIFLSSHEPHTQNGDRPLPNITQCSSCGFTYKRSSSMLSQIIADNLPVFSGTSIILCIYFLGLLWHMLDPVHEIFASNSRQLDNTSGPKTLVDTLLVDSILLLEGAIVAVLLFSVNNVNAWPFFYSIHFCTYITTGSLLPWELLDYIEDSLLHTLNLALPSVYTSMIVFSNRICLLHASYHELLENGVEMSFSDWSTFAIINGSGLYGSFWMVMVLSAELLKVVTISLLETLKYYYVLIMFFAIFELFVLVNSRIKPAVLYLSSGEILEYKEELENKQ